MSEAVTEFIEIDPEEIHLVDVPASKFSPLMAKSQQKGKKMPKKTKRMSKKDLARQIMSARKSVSQLDRTGDASRSLPTVAAAQARVFGGMAHPFAPLEDRVRHASADLEKARSRDNGTGWEVAAATEDLRRAQGALTKMKMIAAEHARQSDPAMVSRAMRGQGVPLVTNRHALGDESGMRYE